MIDLHQKQIEIEKQYSHESILASIQQTLDAMDEGRICEVSIGKRILAKGFAVTKETLLNKISTSGTRGIASKYYSMLQRVPIDIVVVAGLRTALSYCTQERSPMLQDVLRSMGQMVETEALIAAIEVRNKVYLDKTLEYLDDAGTVSLNHRNRTFHAAANSLKMEVENWTSVERLNVGKILMTAIFETGLFQFKDFKTGKRQIKDTQIIVPSEALEAHLQQALESARSIVRYPPMIVPPVPRTGLTEGGYLTSWYQVRAELCTVKAPKSVRKWVYERLDRPEADELKLAMTKAQEVPYRVNKRTLDVLSTAVAQGKGAFGTPRTEPTPRAEFPFEDGWDREQATPEELQAFNSWKSTLHSWYTTERTRVGQSAGIRSKLKELHRFKKYPNLYFPTFVDWRGRMYFRSSLNPQSSDAVKGCLEFAEGKVLGERGLFWLKVHVANCAGFDKHDPVIKAKWTDDNLTMLFDFMENPLDVSAPDPETSSTLYLALCALAEALALPDPRNYVCHVPVAMDATCSGLQHFSAMLRDPIGAKYTNLADASGDTKEDIYLHVGAIADELKATQTTDVLIRMYWDNYTITRNWAKKPVMTYVYGSTLQSTMEDLTVNVQADGLPTIKGDNEEVLYAHRKLVPPIAKAIRKGVELTVPAAAEGMKYLHALVRCTDYPIKWVSPVGMPVVNWTEKREITRLMIRSMGRSSALCSSYTGKYDRSRAVSGIAPNYVHSMDSAHLCKVLVGTSIRIIPIHDSFATHPCDVDELHSVLRETFISMYQRNHLMELASTVVIKEDADIVVPNMGTFDLNLVRSSRFMFC